MMEKHHKMINKKLINISSSITILKLEMQNQSILSEVILSALTANNILSYLKNEKDTLPGLPGFHACQGSTSIHKHKRVKKSFG